MTNTFISPRQKKKPYNARAEGVSKATVGDSIAQGLRRIEKIIRKFR